MEEVFKHFGPNTEYTWTSKSIEYFTKIMSWMTLFTSLYLTKDVRPYMHVLVAHVPILLRDVGSLANSLNKV